jgi:hypothetical protein
MACPLSDRIPRQCTLSVSPALEARTRKSRSLCTRRTGISLCIYVLQRSMRSTSCCTSSSCMCTASNRPNCQSLPSAVCALSPTACPSTRCTCRSRSPKYTGHWWPCNRDSLVRIFLPRKDRCAWFGIPWLTLRTHRWYVNWACWVCWTCRCWSTCHHRSVWRRLSWWFNCRAWNPWWGLSRTHYFVWRLPHWWVFNTSLTFDRFRHSCN